MLKPQLESYLETQPEKQLLETGNSAMALAGLWPFENKEFKIKAFLKIKNSRLKLF